MNRHVFVAAVAALAAVGGTSVASAQGSGCEDAALRISSNALPRVGAKEWNDWVTLTGCGTRGATIIGGALQSDGIRTETELTRLDHLAGILDGWFQPQLISAYENLIRSPDASNAIRLRAMWLLTGLYAPETDVAGPLQGYMSARCETYGRSTTLRDAPQTLPAAAYDQANDAIAYAAGDQNAPEYVRTTANCWQGVIRDELKNGTEEVQGGGANPDVVVQEPAPVVIAPPVRVVYECGSQFAFYNDAGYDLAVRYDGYGSDGVLRVVQGGPYIWAATRFGPVHFWLGDREIWYSDAVYRPCGNTIIVAPAVRVWTGWHVGLGVFFNTGFYGRRYVRPRVLIPVVGRRPFVINRHEDGFDGRRDPRDGRDGRDGRDVRDGRDGRRDEGWNDPRGGAPRTAVPRGGDARNSGPGYGDPRTGGSRNSGPGNGDPRNGNGCCGYYPPRTAVPTDGGRHSEPAPNPGTRHISAPQPRPMQGAPRYAIERPVVVERSAPAPQQRSAPPTRGGGERQGGGGQRGGDRQGSGHASQGHGKPGR